MNSVAAQSACQITSDPSLFVGRHAPDFELPCTRTASHPDAMASLDDYRGRWLILMFYPRDFSLVCPTEITAMNRRYDELVGLGADMLAVSTDALDSHERWIATSRPEGGLGPIAFPLGSDAEGEVSRAYRVCAEGQRVALRGLYIIDPNSIVQYEVVHGMSVGRRTDEIFRVLTALQTGGMCAESWQGGSTLDPIREIKPGSVISHYRIKRKIGEGGFSAVYEAHDRTLQRKVAVKIPRRQNERTRAILTEARAAAALNHPNVCTIHGVETDEGISLIVMELLSGRTLRELIDEGPVSPSLSAEIGCQVAAGMVAAHDAGVVHGDLKPANIVLTDASKIKILDFGLATRCCAIGPQDDTASLTCPTPDRIGGTPSYMSPEQVEGEAATRASDLFSFGLILFEMLTGRPAFADSSLLRVLRSVRTVEPERIAAKVDGAFRPLLQRMLKRQPETRTITMREVETTLSALA